MGFQLEDGKGSGIRASVSHNNRLNTDAVTETEISFESEKNGMAFAWTSVTYDYAAGDTILLVKNTSSTNHLIIQNINMTTDTATIAHIHIVRCPTPTGTALTGVNLNSASANVAEATAKADETSNTLATTGIIRTSALEADKDNHILLEGSVILSTNDCIAIDYVTDGAAATVTITGYYHQRG